MWYAQWSRIPSNHDGCSKQCVCVCVCTYTHTHTICTGVTMPTQGLRIYSYTYRYIHTHIHTAYAQGAQVRPKAPNIFMHIYIYIYIYMHIHTHTYCICAGGTIPPKGSESTHFPSALFGDVPTLADQSGLANKSTNSDQSGLDSQAETPGSAEKDMGAEMPSINLLCSASWCARQMHCYGVISRDTNRDHVIKQCRTKQNCCAQQAHVQGTRERMNHHRWHLQGTNCICSVMKR